MFIDNYDLSMSMSIGIDVDVVADVVLDSDVDVVGALDARYDLHVTLDYGASFDAAEDPLWWHPSHAAVGGADGASVCNAAAASVGFAVGSIDV